MYTTLPILKAIVLPLLKPKPIPIQWDTQDDIWVEQWPILEPKLTILKMLVEEQLKLGHIEPSTSPHNTPVFVIPKRNGKHRLLQDLRPINKPMKKMGSFQSELPHPASIPNNYHIIAIDIKDCFISIPIAQQDKPYFTFMVWEPNTGIPAQR